MPVKLEIDIFPPYLPLTPACLTHISCVEPHIHGTSTSKFKSGDVLGVPVPYTRSLSHEALENSKTILYPLVSKAFDG